MATPAPPVPPVLLRRLPGLTAYEPCVAAMREFTASRGPETPDELWLLQHPPVYTLGLNTNPAHLLSAGTIPVVQTDRGGQVTYHGPGQLVAYLLLDLQRAGLGIRQVVCALEDAVIALAASARHHGFRPPGGARCVCRRRQAREHRPARAARLHLSRAGAERRTDLAPFAGINPCGYPGLAVTSLQLLGVATDLGRVGSTLATLLLNELGLTAGAVEGAR